MLSPPGSRQLADFQHWLKLSMDCGAKEGMAQLSGGDGSVNIMTVHAAKGLEFPIVFVPEMNFFRKDDTSMLSFSHDLGIGVEAPDPDGGYAMKPTVPKRMIDSERSRKESAERKRLLYVALTRAQDHLIMCGHDPDEREQERELWINWILRTTDLTIEDIAHGRKAITDKLVMRIISDPSSIEISDRTAQEKRRLRAEEIALFITAGPELDLEPSERVLSPSTISKLVRGKDKIAGGRTEPPEIDMSGKVSSRSARPFVERWSMRS